MFCGRELVHHGVLCTGLFTSPSSVRTLSTETLKLFLAVSPGPSPVPGTKYALSKYSYEEQRTKCERRERKQGLSRVPGPLSSSGAL